MEIDTRLPECPASSVFASDRIPAWLKERDAPENGVGGGASGALVIVGKAHDVVLAEIRSRLHFDDVQRLFAGILQPVFHAQRNVRGLVLAQDERFLAARDRG